MACSSHSVEPNDEQFRKIYEDGFQAWAQLLPTSEEKLPPHSFLTRKIFRNHPSFPRRGLADLVSRSEDQAFVTASSHWDSSSAGTCCSVGTQPFEKPVRIGLTKKHPLPVSISNVAEARCSWFDNSDNYLSVLILAWSYILSARWAELMPTICSLNYTAAHAAHINDGEDTIDIDISYADGMEAQWWSAILSPGQGWEATMSLENATFLSPWSLNIESSPRLNTSTTVNHGSFTNPNCSMACEYLKRFCGYHNIFDQSHAALSAVLLLPSRNDKEKVKLPAPVVSPRVSPRIHLSKKQYILEHPVEHLGRLLTLSCNTLGILPMLLSVFYNPEIDCNTVTPWLQGTLAAINLANNDSYMIGRMCMDRTPEVAYLWLGATVLGLQDRLLGHVQFGQIPFDLHSATWSGTIQSFIQEPISTPLVTAEKVSRADECRWLFSSQSQGYIRYPISQWKPFGATYFKDVSLEVRAHSDCENHGLFYKGLKWGTDTIYDHKPLQESPLANRTSHGGKVIQISYENLNRGKQFISEAATRSIFEWLRFDGWPTTERHLAKHPWIEIDSDEEEMSSEGSI